MTPKERVKAAMDLRKPDKTPLMCQFSIGHMLLQLDVEPHKFWFDKKVFADGLIRLREIYDFDGILISLHGHDPEWEKQINKIEYSGDKQIAELLNGNKVIFPPNDLPYYEFTKEEFPVNISNVVIEDLPKDLDYIPVSQNLHFKINLEHKFDVIEDIVNREGEQYSIHGEVTSPFDYLLDMLGYQEALMALIMEPDKCKLILQHFTDLIKKLAIEMCATKVDAIKISSPFAGSSFISPAHYKEFVLPYEKEIATAIRNLGIHTYTHTCGSIDDRLELMFEAGISGIECLDPPPLGNVELSNAFERIGSRGFIKGNIDSVNTLLNGEREDIISDVKKRLMIGKKGDGFILSTACSIAPDVKRENILLLRNIIESVAD